MVCRRREGSAKVRAGASPLGFLYDARSWGNYETAENHRTSEHAVLAIVGISAVVLAICLAPTEKDPRNHVGGIHPASDCDPHAYGPMCCNAERAYFDRMERTLLVPPKWKRFCKW
jgi:hypothetical protein